MTATDHHHHLQLCAGVHGERRGHSSSYTLWTIKGTRGWRRALQAGRRAFAIDGGGGRGVVSRLIDKGRAANHPEGCYYYYCCYCYCYYCCCYCCCCYHRRHPLSSPPTSGVHTRRPQGTRLCQTEKPHRTFSSSFHSCRNSLIPVVICPVTLSVRTSISIVYIYLMIIIYIHWQFENLRFLATATAAITTITTTTTVFVRAFSPPKPPSPHASTTVTFLTYPHSVYQMDTNLHLQLLIKT